MYSFAVCHIHPPRKRHVVFGTLRACYYPLAYGQFVGAPSCPKVPFSKLKSWAFTVPSLLKSADRLLPLDPNCALRMLKSWLLTMLTMLLSLASPALCVPNSPDG